MAEWSRLTPGRISPEIAQALLTRHWDFAEDALVQLFEHLGLFLPEVRDETSQFEGARSLMNNGKMGVGDDQIDLENVRFVLGYAASFVGIWDRNKPGPPIEAFPLTEAGDLAAKRRWYELVTSIL